MLGRSRPRSPGPHVSRVGGRDLRSDVSRSLRLPWVEALPPGQCPRLACGPGERHTSVLHVVTLLACAVTIYLACEWFINAIEWLGVELKVGPLTVGTVLAAVGTALPESIVTLVAAVFGSPTRGDDIAVGAAMGGPLVVGTIAYGVTGAMLLWRRRRLRQGAPRAGVAPSATGTEHHTSVGGQGLDQGAGVDADGPVVGVDTAALARDQRWFLTIFIFKVALGLVTFALKPWLGLLFFAAFALYIRREMSPAGEQASGQDLEPLKLQPQRAKPTRAGTATLGARTILKIEIRPSRRRSPRRSAHRAIATSSARCIGPRTSSAVAMLSNSPGRASRRRR